MGEKTKSLVTGGLGFVGRHLVDALVARGDDVTVVDIAPDAGRDDVTYRRVDLRDAEAVKEALAGQDVVFHNASLVHTKMNRIEDVWAVNLDGTRHVIEACEAHGVGKLIYVSSGSVVYEGSDIEHGDESLPYARKTQAPYADSKIAAEKLVLARDSDALHTCAIRPHVIFGPGDGRFLPAVLERAKNGSLKFGVGREHKLSDFTYIDNLVDSLLAAEAKLGPDGSANGRAYFVTNGEPMSFWEFVARVLRQLDLPPVKYFVPYRLAYGVAAIVEGLDTLRGGTLNRETGMSRFAIRYMCTHHYFDIGRAKRELDWEPKVSIDEGIRRTAEHARAAGLV